MNGQRKDRVWFLRNKIQQLISKIELGNTDEQRLNAMRVLRDLVDPAYHERKDTLQQGLDERDALLGNDCWEWRDDALDRIKNANTTEICRASVDTIERRPASMRPSMRARFLYC